MTTGATVKMAKIKQEMLKQLHIARHQQENITGEALLETLASYNYVVHHK